MALAITVMLIGIAGCGDDDSATDRAAESAESGETLPVPSGPSGTITAESIGDVEVGMSMDEVEAIFGVPEEEQEVNFGGGAKAPQVNWLWDVADGTVYLEFETATDKLTGYHVSSSEFSTADGVSVGDPIKPIQARLGESLERAPIGTGFVISVGEPGTFPALTLAVQGGRIIDIRGGSLTGAAGE